MSALDHLPIESRWPVHCELRDGVPLVTAIRNEAARVKRNVPFLPPDMAKQKAKAVAHLEAVADELEPVHPVDGSIGYWTVMRDRDRGRVLAITPERETREEAEQDLAAVRERFPDAWISRCRYWP